MISIAARLGAASGAFYVIAVMIGGSLEWGTGILAAAAYSLVLLGFTAFVVFVAFLHRVLRDAEGPSGWLATVALGAGLLHSAVASRRKRLAWWVGPMVMPCRRTWRESWSISMPWRL